MTEQQDQANEALDTNSDEFDDYADDYAPKPGWIKPVGIISIVWGAIGILLTVLGIAGLLLGPQFLKSAINQGGLPEVVEHPPITVVGGAVFGMVWAVFLMVSAIMLLLQKPKARTLFIVYATVGIATTILGTWLQLDYQQQIAQWVDLNPNADYSTQFYQPSGNMIGLVVGVTLGLAWPVICLIVFGLIKTKPEHYRSGSPNVA